MTQHKPKRIIVTDVPRHPDQVTLEGADPEDTVQVPNELAGQVDLDQLAHDLGADTIWVGEDSKWALPWEPHTGTWSLRDGLTVNTDDPDDMVRALRLVIRWGLNIYPTLHEIRVLLAGKNLADSAPRTQASHADLLLELAAGKDA